MKFDKYLKKGAYHYDWYDDPKYAWYKKCADRCVEFCKGRTIDVGGGDGLVAGKINEAGYSCIVIDNEQTAIDICKDKGIRASLLDLENHIINIYDEFDYVVCLNTIEHLKHPIGLKDIVRQAKRGAIIITDEATEHKGRYHEHEYTKDELLKTFKEFKPNYFEINSTEYGKSITFIGVEIRK